MSDAIAGNDPLKKAIDEHKGQLTGAPLAHYEERFAAADPELAAARCGVAFERAAEGGGVFRLTVLGRPLEMAWPSMEARYADGEGAVPDKMRIVVAELILDGQLAPGTGKFIPYSDVPWGDHYLKAFQGRCLARLAYMFRSAEAFSAACEKVGGRRTESGDASYEIEFVEGVFLRLTIWEADEEFPPSSQILFSDNAPLAFTAEDLAVVGDLVLGALKAARG